MLATSLLLKYNRGNRKDIPQEKVAIVEVIGKSDHPITNKKYNGGNNYRKGHPITQKQQPFQID